jgi:hypothetical protein
MNGITKLEIMKLHALSNIDLEDIPPPFNDACRLPTSLPRQKTQKTELAAGWEMKHGARGIVIDPHTPRAATISFGTAFACCMDELEHIISPR